MVLKHYSGGERDGKMRDNAAACKCAAFSFKRNMMLASTLRTFTGILLNCVQNERRQKCFLLPQSVKELLFGGVEAERGCSFCNYQGSYVKSTRNR